jgi:toxin CcdB
MARYDLYSLDDGGLVIDVQVDLLDHFKTRVVIPLLPADSAPPALKRLNPSFEIEGRERRTSYPPCRYQS